MCCWVSLTPGHQGYTDTWRHLHPNTADMFSVWEERTSARAFNVVRGWAAAAQWSRMPFVGRD
jgi:exonuclease III